MSTPLVNSSIFYKTSTNILDGVTLFYGYFLKFCLLNGGLDYQASDSVSVFRNAKTVVIAYGHILNSQELLRSCGKTPLGCDAENICRLYQQSTLEIFQQLRGDFQFLILDLESARLTLFLSPFANTRLYFSIQNGEVMVSNYLPKIRSELKSKPTLNRSKLVDLLALTHDISNETYYNEIKQVSSGNILQLDFSDAAFVIRKQVEYVYTKRETFISNEQEADILINQETYRSIMNAVKGFDHIHCALSGGLDSSAIAAYLIPQKSDALSFHSYRSSQASIMETNLNPLRQNNTQLDDFISMNAQHDYRFYDESNFHYDYSQMTHFCYEISGSPERNPCNIPWILSFFENTNNQNPVFLGGSYGELSFTYVGETSASKKRLAFNSLLNSNITLKRFYQKKKLKRVSLLSNNILNQFTEKQLDSYLSLTPRTRSQFVSDALKWNTAVSSIRGAIQAHFGCCYHTPASDIDLIETCLGVDEHLFGSNQKPRDLVRRMMADKLPDSILTARVKGVQNAGWYVSLRKLYPYYESLLPKIAKHPLLSEILDVPRLVQLMKDFKHCPNSKLGKPKYVRLFRYAMLRALHVSEWVLFHED